MALIPWPIGLVIGGLVVATADGGLGTGNGLGGGIVAMVVGLIGMSLAFGNRVGAARARPRMSTRGVMRGHVAIPEVQFLRERAAAR